MVFSNVETDTAGCVPPEAQNPGSAYFKLMIGVSYGLCSFLMLILYETLKDVNWVALYPIMSSVAAFMTI